MLKVMTLPVLGPAETEATPAPPSLERQAQGGDRDALGRLLREHAEAIHKLCHFVSGPSDARDAAQEALERIVTRIEQFDPDRGSFRSWALTVARNVCRDRLRRRGLEKAAFIADGETQATAARSEAPDPERIALARVQAGALGDALQTLPEQMRTAVVMFHVHEASYEEIASALDVPMGTVMTWLHRGRKRLRDALQEQEQGV